MELHAFTLLCGLGAVTGCAHINQPGRLLWLWGLMLLLGLVLFSPLTLLPFAHPQVATQPSHTALLLVLAAAWLLRSARPWAAVALGGLLGAQWITALLAVGYPLVFALGFPLSVSALTLGLSLQRRGFRNAALLQEALVMLLGVALVIALVPELIAGWRSATALQGIDAGADTATAGGGSVLVTVLCVLLGILYARWKYK